MKLLGKAIPENMTNVIPPSNPTGATDASLDTGAVDNGEEVIVFCF
jgi:hypothetical protein